METQLLDEIGSREFLMESGVGMNRFRRVSNCDELVQTCENLSFPLAMKLVSPKISHKSDIGGVILDVENMDEAFRAYASLLERAALAGLEQGDIGGVSVQEQLSGVEMLLGMKRDPVFGPVLAIGAGGILVDLLGDVVLGICPLSRNDVLKMLGGLKCACLLKGYRGMPVADCEAFVDMALALARFGQSSQDWLEIDLNPVIVLPAGRGAFAVDARVIVRM